MTGDCDDENGRVDRASRLIRAPAERIFAAFVDGAQVVRWLPPAGARATLDAFEPRPGGAFRMTLHFAADVAGKTTASSDTVDGEFVEIVPPLLVSQRCDFVADDPRFAGTMTMVWRLRPEAGGTLVEVSAHDVPPGIAPEDHEAGMRSSLANLATLVED